MAEEFAKLNDKEAIARRDEQTLWERTGLEDNEFGLEYDVEEEMIEVLSL